MNADDRIRLEELEEKITTIHAGIERIERALRGDDEMGQPGLVARIQKLEDTAKNLENARWYVVGAIAVITTVAGLAAWAVNMYLKLKGS